MRWLQTVGVVLWCRSGLDFSEFFVFWCRSRLVGLEWYVGFSVGFSEWQSSRAGSHRRADTPDWKSMSA